MYDVRRMYSVFYISIQLVQILVVLFSTDIMHLNSAQLFTELQLSMQCSSLLLQQCVSGATMKSHFSEAVAPPSWLTFDTSAKGLSNFSTRNLDCEEEEKEYDYDAR